MGPGGRGAQQDSGPSGEVKAGAGRERGRTWGPLLGSLGGVLWGSQAKIGLVSSDQKEQGFGELRGVLSKGHTQKALGVGGRLYPKGHWGVISGTYIYV